MILCLRSTAVVGYVVTMPHGADWPIIGFLNELARFMLTRKKYWLFPIVLMLLLVASLFVLGQVSAVAPFIYTIF